MKAEEMAEQGVYVVEKVLEHRRQGRGWSINVLWEGYAQPSWEPLRNLVTWDPATKGVHVCAALNEYVKQNRVSELASTLRHLRKSLVKIRA